MESICNPVDLPSFAQAPLLRTEKDRREWLVRELELCNMSSEFRKVIDGELAQRAEASRKLKVRSDHSCAIRPCCSPVFSSGCWLHRAFCLKL